MTECRIYQPSKNAMQSGRANLRKWVLEFEPAEARRADPLMGWIGSGDTNGQVRMTFPSRDDAVAFAKRKGLTFHVQTPNKRTIQPKNYSENYSTRFRFS